MVSTKELKNIAKERKLNYHNLSKEDLSRMLKIPIFKTKRYYQNIAKDRNLKNYQNLKIADLVQLLNMNPEIPISEKTIPKPEKPISEKPISEKPIPAPRRKPIPKPEKPISEKPIPAPRRKPIPKPEKPISEKPIPAPRRKPIPKPEKPISKKPIPAPRRNPPTIQKAIDTMLGWVDWFRESGKKITQPISSALNTLRKKKYPL